MSNTDGSDNQQPTGGYQAFRQRLDAVLRRRDPAALRDFLVAEGQWDAGAQTDVDMAMWMMIATSKALAHLHDEARAWLLAHGHAAEVNAIFGERPRPNGSGGPGRPPARRGPPPGASRRPDGGPRGGRGGQQGGYPGRGPDRRGDNRRPRG
jgi:hypothetical protein